MSSQGIDGVDSKDLLKLRRYCWILLLMSCGGPTEPGDRADEILFWGRSGPGGDDVYVVSVATGETRQITSDGMSTRAEWSPDGERIVFESRRAVMDMSTARLFVMNSDGSDQVQLTDPIIGVDDVRPVWAPSGREVLFTRGDDLYVVEVSGSTVRRLTDGFGPINGHVWSPDGSSIAFVSRRDGSAEIFTIPAAGGAPVKVTSAGESNRAPAWSPDGSRLAFEGFQSGNPEIQVLDIVRGEISTVTNNPYTDTGPVWSPSGSGRLAFVSLRDGNLEVYTINADGTGLENLSDSPGVDSDQVWSPDGSRMAFTSDRTGELQVYVVDTGARSQPVPITNFSGFVFVPRWRPR